MPHPNGGRGNDFHTKHSFKDAFSYVQNSPNQRHQFLSTTNETITASLGMTRDGIHNTIVFHGENGGRVGNVCNACWGYRKNCSGTRIGQCVEGLD